MPSASLSSPSGGTVSIAVCSAAAASAPASGVEISTMMRSFPDSSTRAPKGCAAALSLSMHALSGPPVRSVPPSTWAKRTVVSRSSGSVMSAVCRGAFRVWKGISTRRASLGAVPISPEQLDAYRKADYVVFSEREVVLRIGEKNHQRDELISAEGATTAAFVTAANPRGEKRTEKENGVANAALQSFVQTAGYPLHWGEGRDPSGSWSEP